MEDMTYEVTNYINEQSERIGMPIDEIVRSFKSILAREVKPTPELKMLDWMDTPYFKLIESHPDVVESKKHLEDIRKNRAKGTEQDAQEDSRAIEWLALIEMVHVERVADTAA